MRRIWVTWLVFGVCLTIVLCSMGWISYTAVRLGRREAEARQQALLEEHIRLALWRMDSALLPILAEDGARPFASYSAFVTTAPRASAHVKGAPESEPVMIPSPLLTYQSDHILLHFQIDPDGNVTSPQVPTGEMRDTATKRHVKHETLIATEERLDRLQGIVRRDELLAALRAKSPTSAEISLCPMNEENGEAELTRGKIEWGYRTKTHVKVQRNLTSVRGSADSGGVARGLMKPVWVKDELLLARRVTVEGKEYVQGCWLNWPVLERWLWRQAIDLLPWARLEPMRSEPGGEERGRVLAGIPARLVPGALPFHTKSWVSPIRFSLIIAWACVALPAIGAALLLLGTVTLSERRASFVSAVTHELRTPLTTLRMYTEMLDEGMIRDDEKRKQYLKTMRAEADRLAHLVENVLAYSRIEQAGDAGRVEGVVLGDLLDRIKDRLTARAEQAGMRLEVEADDEASATTVLADPSAVEQILFNLVDNACKYASSASEPVIHLDAEATEGAALIRVCDHGPGITRKEARRLFRPFCKSAHEAAHTAPGVGLGLALSRRLARKMGGDLRLDASVDEGACFVLSLRESKERK
ncbi:MAG: HAMP domain-containing sensor histidine kinase [Planctomycetota bacterium]